MKNNLIKKAFTLVEMLIVVVIIWILIIALLPKFKWAQKSARDTSRKAHLSNYATAIVWYFATNGEYLWLSRLMFWLIILSDLFTDDFWAKRSWQRQY